MAKENQLGIAPAGLGNTVFICRKDGKPFAYGTVINRIEADMQKGMAYQPTGIHVEVLRENPMQANIEMPAESIKKRFRYQFFPTRLPRKEKKRRKVRGYITSVTFGLANDNKEYVYLFHNHAMGAALPLLSAEHKARWQRVAAWLNARSKRSLDLNKAFRI